MQSVKLYVFKCRAEIAEKSMKCFVFNNLTIVLAQLYLRDIILESITEKSLYPRVTSARWLIHAADEKVTTVLRCICDN